MAEHSSFRGFPAEGFDFYAALAANNSKAWWTEHRARYEEFVKAPLASLADELAAEFGEGKMFRPYNDTRFHKGKPPIKEHQGVAVDIEDAVAYYVQVSAEGVMVAGGWYSPMGGQIERYREAVEGPRGTELESMLKKLARRFELDLDQLKTRPRGIDADHPRLDLLRNRRVVGIRRYPVEPWLGTRKALTSVRDDWRALRPLVEWLADNVGPGSRPGDDD